VYCAFNRFKKNPSIEIKEISEKCTEVDEELGKISTDNLEFIETIQENLKELQSKKKEESEKATHLFDSIISFLEEKKKEALDGIKTIFLQNSEKLNEKHNFILNKMEQAENLKLNFETVCTSNIPKFFDVNSKYKNFLSEQNAHSNLSVDINEVKFIHEDASKLMRYISNFADLKTKQKIINFIPKHYIPKKGNSNNFSNSNSNNINNNNHNNHLLNNQNQLVFSGLRKPYEDNLLPKSREVIDHRDIRENRGMRDVRDNNLQGGKIQYKPKSNKPQQQVNEVLDTSEFANEYNQHEESPKKPDPLPRNNQNQTSASQIPKSYNSEFSANIDRLKKDLNKFNLGHSNIQGGSFVGVGGGYEPSLTTQSSNFISLLIT